MGRTIPSISARLDAKIAQWERFSKLLNAREREAFGRLVSVMRDHRTAIDAADEADIGVAILLSMIIYMETNRNARGGISIETKAGSGGGLDERAGGEAGEGAMRDPCP